MSDLVVQNIDIELRKINARKAKISRKAKFQIEKLSDEEIEDLKNSTSFSLGFKQKSDKNFVEFFIRYNIPSYVDMDIEISAEFIGKVTFDKPFDFSTSPKEVENDEIQTILIPEIMSKVDIILKPIFESMNLQYEPVDKGLRHD